MSLFGLGLKYCKLMLFYKVLFLFSRLTRQTEHETFETHESLKSYCPLTNFCSEEQISYNITTGFEPCCRSCSCKPDCKLSHDCCQERFASSDFVSFDACVFAGVTETEVFKEFGSYFWMVDKCPDLETDCKNQMVAPWGSVFPVSSPAKRETYVNSHCARCHNATDLLPWSIVYVCQLSKVFQNFGTFSIEDFLLGLRGCSIDFIPPISKGYKPDICHNPTLIVRECLERYNTYVLTKLCNSFNATFTYSQTGYRSIVFGNIYCFLCNIGYARDEYLYECPKIDDVQLAKGFFDNALLSIIDYEEIQKLITGFKNVSQSAGGSIDDTICGLPLDTRKDECRPILCPEGQYRDKSNGGECRHIRHWSNMHASVLFNLTYTSSSNRVSIDCLIQEYKTGNQMYLDLPNLNDFKHNLYFHYSTDFKHAAYFVAKLFRRSDHSLFPVSVLSRIQTTLNNTIRLNACKRTYSLYGTINRYLTYRSYNGIKQQTKMNIHCPEDLLRFVPTWAGTGIQTSEPCDIPRPLNIVPVSNQCETINDKNDSLWLTTTFFCDQIELREKEFEDLHYRIHIPVLKLYLGDAEFRRVPTSDGRHIIKTCVNNLLLDPKASCTDELALCAALYALVLFILTVY